MTVSATVHRPLLVRRPTAALRASVGASVGATVARHLFERAVGADPRPRHLARRSPHRRGRYGRAGVPDRAARGLLRPARPRHQDRHRRGLHGRRLEGGARHGPRRPADPLRRQPHQPGSPAPAAPARRRRPAHSAAAREHHRGVTGQHPGALRPEQRSVRRLPRPHPELLVGLVRRGRTHRHRDGSRSSPAPQDRRCPRLRRRGGGRPGAGDRNRLGDARHPGRAARRAGNQRDHLPRATGAGEPAGRGGRSHRPGGPAPAGLPRSRRVL